MQNDEIIMDQLLKLWHTTIEKATEKFDTLSAWAIEKEVAPGYNKAKYIIGHLIVFQDKMIEAMELGERFYPDLDDLFIEPQDNTKKYPDYQEMREKWIRVNNFLSEKFRRFRTDDWLSKHHYVNQADFEKEPHRNKLAIFITRNNHLYSHIGQLRLIK